MKKIILLAFIMSTIISGVTLANQSTLPKKDLPSFAPIHWQSKGPTDPYTITVTTSRNRSALISVDLNGNHSPVTITNCNNQTVHVNENSAIVCELSSDAPLVITADKQAKEDYQAATGMFEIQ